MLTQRSLRWRVVLFSCCLGLTSLLVQVGSPVFAQIPDQPTVTATHIMTPHDTIPRFCGNPTVVAQSNGSWSDPRTWSTNQVPGLDARVSIPQNIQVTYNVDSEVEIKCIEVAELGELQWATNQNTRLRVTHVQVLPNGTLSLGTTDNPISANHTAELIIRDEPLAVNGRDPRQYGNGLNVFGTMNVHGSPMERSHLRFSSEAHVGQSTLQIEQAPIGWKSGDRLIIPDTRQIPFRKKQKYFSQAEEPTVLSLSGSTVTLSAPLQFDHWGPRDADGEVGAIEQGMLPHVGNLTRNVIIRSTRLAETSKTAYCMGAENVNNPSSCITRGHTLFLRRATVDIRYASFENLGRTTNDSLDNTVVDGSGNPTSIGLNQIGRYSIHMHRMMGPVNPSNSGYQYYLIGNVIEGMLKWGLAVHDTHYGLIKDNIAYDGQGAAITTEDGNESFNVFERNFVVHTKAGDEEQV
ncbi:MAG: G8 domain-containing protein, partial [Nitrospirales bacterium]